MDHLPKPRDSLPRAFIIPYLCKVGFKYDATSSFTDYGSQLGWSFEDGEFHSASSPSEIAIIMQIWLFFGMATEFFKTANVHLETEDLVRKGDDRIIIATDSLRPLLARWVDGIKDLDNARRVAASESIERLLITAQVTARNFDEQQDADLGKVMLSVFTLGATFTYFRRETFKRSGLCPLVAWQERCSYRSWGRSAHLISFMQSNGWCSSEIAYLSSSVFSVVGLAFAAQMQRPKENLSHVSCSETQCVHLQVDEKTYETKHTEPRCKCDHVDLDTDRICDMIHRGGIPVIRMCKAAQSSTPSLELIEGKDDSKYVAISHVSAHGLGHASENSLPGCQMQRLYYLIQNLDTDSQDVCFWIDTLCIPTGAHAEMCRRKHDALSCRKIAIGRLKETYRNAAKVLVLDRELQRSKISFSEETLTRVLISAWMRRLWTFREAKLARQLHFQIEDKAVRLEEMFRSLDITEYHSLWEETAQHIMGLRGILDQSGNASNIASLWNSFQSRTTSNPGDEAACLSILLGSDTHKILNTPEQDRMQTFYSMQDIVPSQILFMPRPRIKAPGYGWAPTSFLSRGQWVDGQFVGSNVLQHSTTHTIDLQSRAAFRSDSGLLLKAPGFILSPTKYPLRPHFSIHDAQDQFQAAVMHMRDLKSPQWDELQIFDRTNLAILLDGPLETGFASLAVLLSDFAVERGIIFAKFECRLWFGAAAEDIKEPTLSPEKVDNDRGLTTSEIATGTLTSMDQTWCIS